MIFWESIEGNDKVDHVWCIELVKLVYCAIGDYLYEYTLGGESINEIGKIGERENFSTTKSDGLELL